VTSRSGRRTTEPKPVGGAARGTRRGFWGRRRRREARRGRPRAGCRPESGSRRRWWFSGRQAMTLQALRTVRAVVRVQEWGQGRTEYRMCMCGRVLGWGQPTCASVRPCPHVHVADWVPPVFVHRRVPLFRACSCARSDRRPATVRRKYRPQTGGRGPRRIRSIGPSECGRDRPGFGCAAVSLRHIQYYRVFNIIN
jgi:hypothetical protein